MDRPKRRKHVILVDRNPHQPARRLDRRVRKYPVAEFFIGRQRKISAPIGNHLLKVLAETRDVIDLLDVALGRVGKNVALLVDDHAVALVAIFYLTNLLIEQLERDVDAGRADVLTVDVDRSHRRHNQLFGEAVDVRRGESEMRLAARVVVPRADGRIDLPGEVARVIAEQIFILQPDCHVENIFVGRGERKQLAIFHSIDVADIAEQVGDVLCGDRLRLQPRVQILALRFDRRRYLALERLG